MPPKLIKEPRPNNLVQSSLTLEKAVSAFNKLIKKIAKDCEVEVPIYSSIRRISGIFLALFPAFNLKIIIPNSFQRY